MKLFIDTARVEEIREAENWGILDGVTTNPTHIAAAGKPFKAVLSEITSIVKGPVSAEVTATEAAGMLAQARELRQIANNIVVKVPVTREGIKAIKWMSEQGIPTNATLNFSPLQALLAAKVGATYISPFVGRLDAIGSVGMDLVRQIKTIYQNYAYPTEIIVAAVRHPEHILQAALAGAHIVTARFDVLKALYDHPLTDSGLEQFLEDWKRVPQEH